MSNTIVETRQLKAFYGDAQALFGIDFTLHPGEVVSIIGANGAGKSTFLKCLTGLLQTSENSILFKTEAINKRHPSYIAGQGMTMVPEGRRLFPSLTVEENLLMGTLTNRKGPWTLSKVYELFPVLKERRKASSTALSGGQQQMVAIGRALMSNPEVLLCDELSLGLAPVVIREIYTSLPAIMADGMAIVIVEQDITTAREISQRLYCFQEGLVSLTGQSDKISHQEISEAYFGV